MLQGEEMNKLTFGLVVFICTNLLIWSIYLIIRQFIPVWIYITLLSAIISYFLTHR